MNFTKHCACGRPLRTNDSKCCKCKRAAGEYDESCRGDLRTLIYNRIQHPDVAEQHYQYALATQARVAGVLGRDRLGRTNGQKKEQP